MRIVSPAACHSISSPASMPYCRASALGRVTCSLLVTFAILLTLARMSSLSNVFDGPPRTSRDGPVSYRRLRRLGVSLPLVQDPVLDAAHVSAARLHRPQVVEEPALPADAKRARGGRHRHP